MVGALYSARTGPVKRFAHFTQDGGIFLRPCLFLTGRAEERGTARLGDAPDRAVGSTVRARSPFATVNEVQVLKPAFCAISLHIIPQGRPSGGNGLLQDLRNGLCERFTLFARQGTGRPFGMNTAAKKRLAHIDIAKARNQFLIQQRGFDRRTPAPEEFRQCRAGHGVGKRLHPQMREKTVLLFFGGAYKIDHAEAAGIDQPRPRTALRFKNQMFVSGRSRVRPGSADRESARHAQVQQHAPPAFKTHENILRAPAE